MRIDAVQRSSYCVLKILIGKVSMVLGWQIFIHALHMVFGNFREALRIVVGPSLLALVLVALFLVLAGSIADEVGDNADGMVRQVTTTGDVLETIFFVVLNFSVTIWIAVAWHRFILFEEYPSGFFPAFFPDRALAYLVTGFLLGLVLAGILLLGVFLPLQILAGSLGYGLLVVAIPVAIFAALVFIRLSVMLPAVAVGRPLSLPEAWHITSGFTGAFFTLLIVSMGFQVLVQIVLLVFAFVPVLQVILSIVIGTILVPLINISILTTLYGVFAEKRDLA